MARVPNLPRTILVVGNGLTLSFLNHAGESMAAWDTRSPLDWDITIDTGQSLRECFPAFYSHVDELRISHPDWPDFAIIDEIARVNNPVADYRSGLRDTELRHFLALAYSHFQAIADDVDLDGWEWLAFVARHADEIGLIISFNYDLMIERLLMKCGIPVLHYTIDHDVNDGILIGKPHGSINYKLHERDIVISQMAYPPKLAMSLIDGSLAKIDDGELLSPRIHVELVPPMQATAIRHFQWVESLFGLLSQYGPLFDRCIFAGLSCWPVDQLELREIMGSLNPTAEIIVANPDPVAGILFDFHARDLGLRRTTSWRNGPCM